MGGGKTGSKVESVREGILGPRGTVSTPGGMQIEAPEESSNQATAIDETTEEDPRSFDNGLKDLYFISSDNF